MWPNWVGQWVSEFMSLYLEEFLKVFVLINSSIEFSFEVVVPKLQFLKLFEVQLSVNWWFTLFQKLFVWVFQHEKLITESCSQVKELNVRKLLIQSPFIADPRFLFRKPQFCVPWIQFVEWSELISLLITAFHELDCSIRLNSYFSWRFLAQQLH